MGLPTSELVLSEMELTLMEYVPSIYLFSPIDALFAKKWACIHSIVHFGEREWTLQTWAIDCEK